jgi:glutathione reductase (NADPH)
VEVNGQKYHGDKILIATGGRPLIPDVPGAHLGISSDGFFDLEVVPKKGIISIINKSVVISGSGYIGVEIAGILQALGSQVHFISRTERILRTFDSLLGSTLMEEMTKTGVKFHTKTSVAEVSLSPFLFDNQNQVKEGENGIRIVKLANGDVIEADVLLWAIGRVPNTDKLQLDKSGVKSV